MRRAVRQLGGSRTIDLAGMIKFAEITRKIRVLRKLRQIL
jgi:hypothetical protein